MVEFDERTQVAKLSLEFQGVAVPFRISLGDVRQDPLLRGSGLDRLSPERYKALLEYCGCNFKPNWKSFFTIQEQFCKYLASQCDILLDRRPSIRSSEFAEIKQDVDNTNFVLLRKAGVKPEEFREAMSYQYFAGVHHMTRDDDFIAVRKGGKVVSIIPLAGNDYNEVKRFITEGREDVLSVRNIGDLKDCVRKVRQQKAADLVRSLLSPRRVKAVNDIKR